MCPDMRISALVIHIIMRYLWEAVWVFKHVFKMIQIQTCTFIHRQLSAVKKLREDTAKRSPVCACSELKWLRRQNILTFQPWIILPKPLIYLLSSALLFSKRDWFPKLCKARTSQKGLAISTNQYPSLNRVFFGRGESVIFCCIISPWALLWDDRTKLISIIWKHWSTLWNKIDFLSIFGGADGNPGYLK